MSPRETDPVLNALDRLQREVQSLAQQVSDHEKKLRWVTSAALLVVGFIGGPNAVDLITSGTI